MTQIGEAVMGTAFLALIVVAMTHMPDPRAFVVLVCAVVTWIALP